MTREIGLRSECPIISESECPIFKPGQQTAFGLFTLKRQSDLLHQRLNEAREKYSPTLAKKEFVSGVMTSRTKKPLMLFASRTTPSADAIVDSFMLTELPVTLEYRRHAGVTVTGWCCERRLVIKGLNYMTGLFAKHAVICLLLVTSCSAPDRPDKRDAEQQIMNFLQANQLGLVIQYANDVSGHVFLCGGIGPNVRLTKATYINGYKADNAHYIVVASATYQYILPANTCLQQYLNIRSKMSVLDMVGKIEPFLDEDEAKTRLSAQSYRVGDKGEVTGFQFDFLKTETGFIVQRVLR